VKSLIGTKKIHRQIIKGMGLRKINHTVCLPDSSATRGMINKTEYLLKIEERE
jgi:large subunit ribosomal protein L30